MTNGRIYIGDRGAPGTQKMKVTVSSDIGVNNSSLKYILLGACSGGSQIPTPLESDFTLTFTNNQEFSPPGGMGKLWILAKDNDGNTTIIESDIWGGACP